MAELFIIGGSPCSGKSTIAEELAHRYNLYYFKADDYLDEYMKRGSAYGYRICKKLLAMSPEQIWMRDPMVQCNEEISYYEETFEFLREDLKKQSEERAIITEGAAYLPNLVKKLSLPSNHYAVITPTREFQISHYSQREWVPYILEGCSDKKKAFENWMERDCLFAEGVNQTCREEGNFLLVNDGTRSIDEMIHKVASYFRLIK